MSFLSNKFKIEVRSSDSHVAKFISYTDTANIKIAPASENSEYCVIGVHASNYETSIGFANTASNLIDTVITLNEEKINIYKDTIIGGNLVIDGYVITTAVDVMLCKEDLFAASSHNGKIDVTSNILVHKQMEIINRGISFTSNVIMQSIPDLSKKLLEDGLDVVTSNLETIEFLRNPYNFSIEKFDLRFASKSADDLREGPSTSLFTNNVYSPDILVIEGDLRSSNAGSSNIYAKYVYASKYLADGSELTNIFVVGDGTVNSIRESSNGCNMFYKAEYVGAIAAASNMHLSNYASTSYTALDAIIGPDFNNTCNYIQDVLPVPTYLLNQIIPEIFSNASNQNIADLKYLEANIMLPTKNTSNYIAYNLPSSYNYSRYIDTVYDISDDTLGKIYPRAVIVENETRTRLFRDYIRNSSTLSSRQTDIANYMVLQSSMVSHYMYQASISVSNVVAMYSNVFAGSLKANKNNLNDLRNSSSNYFVINTGIAMAIASNIISAHSNQSISHTSNTIGYQHDNLYNISNMLIENIQYLDELSSNTISYPIMEEMNYIQNTLPYLYAADAMTSNFAQVSSNILIDAINLVALNLLICNTLSCNQLEGVFERHVDTILANTVAKYQDTDSQIRDKFPLLHTDKIANGTSNFYYTEQKFDELFSLLSYDNFANGTSNHFIVNNTYNSNLNILGTLYASNITIGHGLDTEISSINTNIYQTGNCVLDSLEVIYDGMRYSQGSQGSQGSQAPSKLFVLNKNDKTPVFIVESDKILLFKSVASYDFDVFDVAGIIKAQYFVGRADLTNVNLDDRTTNQLMEGSNLYFSHARAGQLINISNMHVSNYLYDTSNCLVDWILHIDNSQSNYVCNESNILQTIHSNKLSSAYAYMTSTSNHIISQVDIFNTSFSNYVLQSSNTFISYTVGTHNNVVQYMTSYSNAICNTMNIIENYHSNYVNTDISPNVSNVMGIYDTNISHYTNRFINNLTSIIDASTIIQSQSNYAAITCNILLDKIKPINHDLLPYINKTSNEIASKINASNVVLNKYAGETAGSLSEYTYAMLEYLNSNTNIYSLTDIYAGEKILHVNFNNINNVNLQPVGTALITDTVIPYESVNSKVFNSSNNVYLYSANHDASKQVAKLMNDNGFVMHFVFKADQVYNTPIYYIGNSIISVVNIKILYGNLYLRLGYMGNSISVFSTTGIKQNAWYIVDLVAYITGGQISLKMFLNKVPQNIVMIKNDVFYGSGLIQTTAYYDALNYVNVVIASEPAMLPNSIPNTGNSYYIAYTEGQYNVVVVKNVICSILMIGGGGGGGYNYGGGGGAGAYYYTTNYVLKSGTYKFYVGAGGAGGLEDVGAQNGGDTYITHGDGIDIFKCKGGGYGGGYGDGDGTGGIGGCGGGGSGWDNSVVDSKLYAGGTVNNTGTVGSGFAGGSGYSAFRSSILSGGGGGGIGSVGQSATAIQKEGGDGGNGLVFDIKGVQEVYGGGGGGGEWATYTTNPAGLGGGATIGGAFVRVGGNAMRNIDMRGGNGMANTGSGGGSGRNAQGGSGGSGIIIVRFSEENNLSMYLGCSNILDVYEDNRAYSHGAAYTNTYFSSNSYISSQPPIIRYSASSREEFSSIIASSLLASNYDYQYSSNIRDMSDADYYDDADGKLSIGNRNVYDLHFVLTEVYTNVRLVSGYYFFVLDLQNEVSADLAIGKGSDKGIQDYFNAAFYYNPARLNNPLADIMHTSNQTTTYPIYIAEGYYRFYLRMLRTVGNRNSKYFIPKYYSTTDWQGASYSLNNSNGVSYVSYETCIMDLSSFSHLYMMNDDIIGSTSNLYAYMGQNVSNYRYNISHAANSTFYAGNRYSSSNLLCLQDFKIFSNPVTMSTEYSINNILSVGRESDALTQKGKVRGNKWHILTEEQQEYIYYNEGNVGIGQIDQSASLQVFTKMSMNYDNTIINSIKTNNPIWTNLGIIMSSDERIKKNIIDISDASALDAILKIEPKMYSHIDSKCGHSNVYGFIAQQIREVIPEAVTLQEGFIPNIYAYGVLEEKQIKLTDVISAKVGDKVLILDAAGNRYVEELNAIYDSSNVWIANRSGISGNVFVYGTFVEDFHSLDKSYIYTLNVCASQELHKRYIDMLGTYYKLQKWQNYDMSQIDNLVSNLHIIKGAMLQRMVFENNIIDYIDVLQKENETLVKSINMYRYLIHSELSCELDRLKIDNNVLLQRRKALLSEFEGLTDRAQNQINEIATIKTIMQMNGLN
jgi:hypothetical protein